MIFKLIFVFVFLTIYLSVANSDMRDFIDCRVQLSIFDHAYDGPTFTWTNKHSEGFIAKKLDRVLINDEWLLKFAQSTVEFLPPEVSDHCPSLIHLEQVSHSPPKPFKFFNYWTRHPDFLKVVEESWKMPMHGSPMSVLHKKLKRLKDVLKAFNQMHFGSLTKRVGDKRKELANVQMAILNYPLDSRLIEQEKMLAFELHDLMLAEECFYKQKSRIDWIQEGDQNTNFFQKMVAAQKSRNTIRVLTDANGEKLTKFSQISDEAVKFFKSLFGTRDYAVSGCSSNILEEILQFSVSEATAAELNRPITTEEIKTSMFSIGGDKAPGPDGFSSHFFKIAWSIVGHDLAAAVHQFFQTSNMLSTFNSTNVVLVPKVQSPRTIQDFRPISCCSVVYKCITKILANRLKPYMPSIISNNQSAFIAGRNITDNVLIAQELVRGYGRSTLSPRCAIKVDLQKAFDSLSWDFITDILAGLKFPCQFIEWIKGCITTPMFSISINGGLVGYFKGARGIRQGDPLSPYLFVLAMNVLSRLLDAAAQHGVFQFHPKCKKITLTHLCFADDLLIFSKGNLESITGIQQVLNLFYTFSGLQLNNSKSELFSTGIKETELQIIQQATGFKVGILPVKYLGVPLITRQLSERDCKPLITKLTARVRHWATKLLSYAGRLQLIQSVLFNIQNYWCRHFILPKRVLRKINQLCSSFFWKGSDTPKRGARVKWSTICLPKTEGGLGVKDIYSWNKACIIQNIWAIISKAGSLWIAWINAYVLKGRSFWQVPVMQYNSWNWRKLLQLRSLASRFVEWKDGVEVWKFSGSRYCVTKVWEEIRPRQERVDWHRLLWTPFAIPRHIVITWMALLDKLPTMDRLAAWGLEVSRICQLCQDGMESRNHLFFGCSFSRGVWKTILELCGLRRDVSNWFVELNWAVRKLKGKSLISLILRVAWRAYIYIIWKERNKRMINQKAGTPASILEEIKGVVRIKLSKLQNIVDDSVNRLLYNNWNLNLLA